LIDVTSSALERALEKVKAASSRADFIATAHVLDITHEAVVDDTLDNIHKNFGRIDYAVNNAGVCKSDEGGLAGATTETWRKMIGVNLGKPFLYRVKRRCSLDFSSQSS
jgi:NAD(P)-dependent dehydrogenase (short-subunit alcohol dehydrogenase family)